MKTCQDYKKNPYNPNLKCLNFTLMDERFGREERLKSKIVISSLFAEGKSLKKFPLRLVYLPLEGEEIHRHKAAVSVPKRSFKKAVDRTHLKRLMREAYRKNKYLVNSNEKYYAFLFIYGGRQKEDYSKIFEVMEELLKRFSSSEL